MPHLTATVLRAPLALVTALLLALAGAPPALAQEAGVAVGRTAGVDRITTATAVSAQGWSGSTVALLATTSGFPDALAAGALAADLDAPLLLTPGNALPDAVAAELGRLAVSEVVILGGPGAVSDTVAAQVRALPGSPSVRRVAGPDRFTTAALAAQEAGAPGGEAIVVSGTTFPDAVSAGALTATEARPPVLLSERTRLPAATRAALTNLGVQRVTVIGGSAAIDDVVLAELRALGLTVTRLSGDSRFATSVAVAEEAMRRFGDRVPVVFATGQNFPDALAAGALAGRIGAPVILVPADGSGVGLDAFLRARTARWRYATVVGGRAAISDVGLDRLRRSVNGAAPRELAASRQAIAEWMAALDGRNFPVLRARSSGPAAVYADYIARSAAIPEGPVGMASHTVTAEPTSAVPLGNRRYAVNIEIDWQPGDGATARLNAWTVHEQADGTFTVETLLRNGRPLSQYILDGSTLGSDYGAFSITNIRWFRRVDQPITTVALLATITNRRSRSLFVDDLAAPLITDADGEFYPADDGAFPEIRPGQSRDVLLTWDRVARPDGGGFAWFIVYGDGGEFEYEELAEVRLPVWPR